MDIKATRGDDIRVGGGDSRYPISLPLVGVSQVEVVHLILCNESAQGLTLVDIFLIVRLESISLLSSTRYWSSDSLSRHFNLTTVHFASVEFDVEWQGELAVKGHMTVLAQSEEYQSFGLNQDKLSLKATQGDILNNGYLEVSQS